MDIVMIPFHDYKKWLSEGFRTRDAHLCQNFERSKEVNKILVVNRPVSLAEIVLKQTSWKICEGDKEYDKTGICLTRMSDKVWCIDFTLPDFFKVVKERKSWWFTAFQYKKICDGINEAIAYLGLEKIILLLQNPMAISAVKNVHRDVFAFDAIDNWLYHPQMVNKELIEKNYDYIDRNADLIFTVSKNLMPVFGKNRNKKWIPNGVDIDYFQVARAKHHRRDKTVIGYVGKIQERVDFDLVEQCARTFPECEFVFWGPIYSQKSRTKELNKRYKNIFFKGDIHYLNLPEAMREIDIAIIPHKVDKFTDSMNPLKLYEYLAAGKAIVSTHVAGIDGISDYVFSAGSNSEFIKLLAQAIRSLKNGEFDADKIAKSISSECSWENRTKMFIEELRCMIKERNE